MHWIMENEMRAPNFAYRIHSSLIKKTPKGFVPIIVGDDDTKDVEERFLVHVKSCFSIILSPLLRKMHWMENGRKAPNFAYRIHSSSIKKTPKGFVPIIVGDDGTKDVEERFLVHVKLLSKPCMVDLLELAAGQFGYGQEGVLRVPCDARHFQKVLDSLEKVHD